MQNTLKNKEKFSALYWGQRIARIKGFKGYQYVRGGVLYHIGEYYLELRPLSDITDEEASNVSDIFFYRGFDVSETFLHDVRSSENIFISNPHVVDYLRSCGFALPYMGMPVETLIEWGWVKLKEEAEL